MSKSDFAFWLGIYASAVASVTALWSLFRELWIERPRIDITPEDAWLVKTKDPQRPLIVKGEATLQTMGISRSACTNVLTVIVRNRGRRDAAIESVSQVIEHGRVNVFGDLLPQTPFLVPAERSSTLVMGHAGGYTHGSLRLKRFFVVDGAGRVHPLRERYRRRVRRVLLKPLQSPPEEPRELEQ